ncbi:glutaminase [Gordoniibacillus kamchatkensis]|uniref:Glutaminase n=1 Tax=Gordoniibacillus kamchatkensis TaxID=1590651 RepID=A0ABR5AKP3_9BACL|nr:glutaminase A [Paenibacillus sp. VKM B-2647]KIL41423.1 glutaminase [Paenibacillus sp. VKM B-2647]
MTNDNEWNELQNTLHRYVEGSKKETARGRVASYIPELAKAPHDALGISLMNGDGQTLMAGDCELRFTMQSISKVFTFILALMDRGEDAVFAKVGKEPTGDDFNSMLKLELVEPGIPFNPFINAGAIAITSMIAGRDADEKAERILQFLRRVSGNSGLAVKDEVYRSEYETAHRNRSLAYFLKDNGVLEDDVDRILDVYFRHCAVEVTCSDVAKMALVLAYGGVDPISGERLIPRRFVQITKTFMITCGMYNASGAFAIEVGLPAKSGVSGGILTLVPGRYGIGVVGPALNRKGNSVAGVHVLQQLSEHFDWSLF